MNRMSMKECYYLPDDNIPLEQNKQIILVDKKTGMYDDFIMTATLFDFNGKLAFWVGMDIISIQKILYKTCWNKLQKVTNELQEEYFILNGTHTHSGPMLSNLKAHFSSKELSEEDMRMDIVNLIADQMVQLFIECKKSLRPFKTEISVTKVENVYSNRNSIDGYCDKSTNLIRFTDLETNKTLGMIFSFATHPTIIFPKNLKLSTDLLGNVRHELAKHYQCPVMHFNGAAGDSSTRLTRKRGKDPELDYQELLRLTNLCINQILDQECFEEIVIDRWEAQDFSVNWNYQLSNKIIRNKINSIKEIVARHPNSEIARVFAPAMWRLELMAEQPDQNVKQTAKCRLINLGGLKICIFPGELAGKFGVEIVKHEKNDHVLVLGYTVDNIGYLIEKEEYGKNFETASTTIPIGIPEVLTELFKDKLKELY